MFEMDRGEAYSSNLRYLRQQILRGGERGETEPFIVNMTVPDQPALTLDADPEPCRVEHRLADLEHFALKDIHTHSRIEYRFLHDSH